ncbi:MAG: molybdopterin-dependent oxidoreductase, partial [Pirellulaceae bacterium]
LHGDGNTRQCMATAVVAYKEAFGFDAPPYTYADFEQSDVIVLVGSNLCIAHPILWQRVLRNPHQPRIVVIDPRRTETAQAATDHLPIRPKSDLTLLYTVANVLIQRNWIDQEFIARSTNEFEAFRDHVAGYTLEAAEAECGIPASQIESLAKLIHQGQRVSFWWTMGVNQSHQGVRTAQAIINLALMTGNLGRPGTGANSITGQCNAMGSRLFSNTTNLLGGHDFAKEADREKIADILEIPIERIPSQASWSYDRIMEGIREERIKGLWVIATNPAHSWIDQSEAKHTLAKLDFLVVQDMYHSTETAQTADLLLPAAGWGEKEGTFINSERRIGLHKKVTKAPGQAMADFQIFRLLAEAWGCGDWFQDWTSPEQVFQKMKRCSAGQPCDFTGISDYAMLDDQRGVQWPCVANDVAPPSRERRLFEDGTFYHTDGKARFVFERSRSSPDAISAQFPFRLLTGRGTAAQWHTQTKTGKSATLRKLYPETLFLQMHPEDAARLEIGEDDWITVASSQGTIPARAQLSQNVGRGNLFLPMHDARVNRLTAARFDPYSRQPSYKDTPVFVLKR